MSATEDEFDEFDVTEDEFDAMAASGVPVEIVGALDHLLAPAPGLYALITESTQNYSSSGSVRLESSPTHATATVVVQRELVSA